MKPQIKNEINALRLAGLKPGEIAQRLAHSSDAWQALEKVLLGCLQNGLVEQPSGVCQPQSILFADLSPVRKGVYMLWKQKSKVLLPRLL